MRVKSGAQTMIQLAPTPFVPEYFIPLQYTKIRSDINPKFYDIYNSIKKEYFEKKIVPMFKIQGLQGHKNWFISVMLHRIEDLSGFVYYCFKNNYRKSSYSERLYDLFNDYCRQNKINIPMMLNEYDTNKEYWWHKIDWSGGELDYKGIVSRRAEKMKLKAYGI